MLRIHFKDEGQDVLWWDVDSKGVVQSCNMQAWAWVGTKVDMAKDLAKSAHLSVTFKDDHCGTWKHPVEKVELAPQADRSQNAKPFAEFVRAAGSDNYHIKLRGSHAAMCGFEPTGKGRSRWIQKSNGRPYFPRICFKCAKRASISPSLSPDEATIRYGEGEGIEVSGNAKNNPA